MQVIAKGKESICKLWCNPPAKADRTGKYRLMRYHVKAEGEGKTFLLNTVTGELVSLNQEEKGLLNRLPASYTPEMDELIAHRFLVSEAFDELKSVIQLRKVLRGLKFCKKEVTTFTILPTSACNARCFYCFESDYPHHSMSEETVALAVDYIASHCGEAKKIQLRWFGGEPTLGEKQIDAICDCLRERDIRFTSTMISNGYLFSREMARKAKEKWQLQSIQITLDGTEEVYNRVKAYVNPQGSPFQRVLDNMGYLLNEGIRVLVRLNLDRHNADNLTLLIDELAERFPKKDHFLVYAHELYEDVGCVPIHRSEDEWRDIVEIKYSLESHIQSKGLRRSKRNDGKELPSLKVAHCMSDNPNTILINPQGKLGKCEHALYYHLVGDLRDGDKTDSAEWEYWHEYLPKEGCKQCPLCPSCAVATNCEDIGSCVPAEANRRLEHVRSICLDRGLSANDIN